MKKTHYLFQIVIACLTLISDRGFSHDFWLEAHPFYTMPQKPVDISIHVGNQFVGDSLPNIVSWYSDFSLYQDNEKKEVNGELGRDPAGYFTPQENGTYAIGYQNYFTYIEIDAETFNLYLKMEGLDNAINYRQKNGLNNTVGKESYIRHPKTLVQSGDKFNIDNSMQNFGYELEIIPLSNPYKKKLNDPLSVKIVYQNKPVKDILLIALSKANPEKKQQIRTNDKGEATIVLDQTGPWLLKAVKIIPVKKEKEDWQSHWASLTFSIR
jgi:uncharacterized GH25 family protein